MSFTKTDIEKIIIDIRSDSANKLKCLRISYINEKTIIAAKGIYLVDQSVCVDYIEDKYVVYIPIDKLITIALEYE